MCSHFRANPFDRYFKAYLGRLMKLEHEEIADKDDMMGADDGANRKASTWSFSSKPNLKVQNLVVSPLHPVM
jgi:hypothetical protein